MSGKAGHGDGFMPLVFERRPAGESVERAASFYDMMRRRRTVRSFSTDRVPYEVIQRAILTAGTLRPEPTSSHGATSSSSTRTSSDAFARPPRPRSAKATPIA